ncbi:MAG: TonB-dependent receptor [Steroidobacter sp.]
MVTGIRSSLQKSLDIKRDASGVVDAITSEDIGKFPDSNVAASMQRIPGVSIQLAGPRGDATGITVRGFSGDFNETLIDGRHISTATGGRSVDFSTVGADFVGGLTVMKTPDVTLSTGSIGATVNISYPKPFDHPGMRFAASLSGNDQSRASKIGPTLGALFSNTFANDTMGLLVDGIYTKRDTTTNHVSIPGWEGAKATSTGGGIYDCQIGNNTCPVNSDGSIDYTGSNHNAWYPQQFVGEQQQVAEKRIDGRLAYQWHPNDKVMLTLDDNYERQDIVTNSYGFGVWFNLGEFRNAQLDSNGTIINFVDTGSNLEGSPGDVMDLNAGIGRSLLTTNQVGLNLDVAATDHLSYNFDAAYAKSKQSPNGNSNDGGDIGYGNALGCNEGTMITGSSSDTLPQLNAFGPSCNASQVLNPANIGSHVLVRQRFENTDTVKQGKFMVSWKQEGLKVDLGASYVTDEFTLQTSDTFTNNFWQTFSGYGAPSGRSTGVGPLPTSLYQGTIGTSDFIHGFSGSSGLIPNLLVYNPLDLYAYLQGLGNPQTQNIPGYNYGCCGTNYTGSLDLKLSPSSIQDIKENTLALFFKTSFDSSLGDLPYHVSMGVRKERTTVSSGGVGQLPTALSFSPGDPTLLTTTFGPTQPIVTRSDYDFLLPSLDARLDVTHDLHLRFDASRTLTRAPINDLKPTLSVGSLPRVGNLTANGGNPTLKPYLSDNVDLGVEWYYQENSYAAIDYFSKHVSNFPVQGSTQQNINGVVDPSTKQLAVYTVSQLVNGPDARVSGLEAAWQHVFGDTGFGYQINATWVTTNKPYDPNDLSQSGFAVTGLADSANLVGFYDKNGIEVRLAVNHRNEYLLQFGQGQNNSNFGSEPVFVNASTVFDLSASYQITSQLNVFFEGNNLTDQVYSTHGRFENQFLDAFDYGRRFTLGLRFKL